MNQSFADEELVVRFNDGFDGEPLLLYESMLSADHLDGKGFQHESAVMAQCLLVREKYAESLGNLKIKVYVAPFDLFNSVIKSDDTEKHERLARRVFGQSILAADVSFIPAAARMHFSACVVVREQKRLFLMDSYLRCGHSGLIAKHLLPFLERALPGEGTFSPGELLERVAQQAEGSNVCGPNISLFFEDTLRLLVASGGNMRTFTRELLQLTHGADEYGPHRLCASAALRACALAQRTSAPVQPSVAEQDAEMELQAASAELACPFEVGDLVTDEIFGAGVVEQLCLANQMYRGPGGQVFVSFDSNDFAPTWRTWGSLSKRKNARSLDMHSFFKPVVRETRARLDPESARAVQDGGGPSGTSSHGAGSSTLPSVAGVQLSSIERARVLEQKPSAPVRGHHSAPAVKSTATRITILQRLREYPDQTLCEDCGELFCRACKRKVTNAAAQIKQHLQTPMHTENLSKYLKRSQEDGEQKGLISDYCLANPAESFTSVPADLQLFRFRAVEAFMGSGIELAKLDDVRQLLERGGCKSLGGASHLRMYIPKVREAEILRLKEELKDQYLAISFDATRRCGDAVNCTARFCNESFAIVYRLVLFVTAEKHLDGANTARLLTQLLLSTLLIDIFRLIAFMRDSVSANGVAVRSLLGTFSCSTDILCVPHTLNNMGAHFVLPVLDEFLTPFITLVCNDGAAKSTWKSLIGEPVVGFSVTRWHCKAEIAMQIGKHFDKLEVLLSKLVSEGIGDATTSKMRRILSEDRQRLRLQLASMMDMRKVVSTTYELEGDGLELLLAYSRIEELRMLGRSLAQQGMLPNVDAVIRSSLELKPGVELRKLWPAHGGYFDAKVISSCDVHSTIMPGRVVTAWTVEYIKDKTQEDLEEIELRKLLVVSNSKERKEITDCLSPGFAYLESRLLNTCTTPFHCAQELELFRLAQAFDPTFAVEHTITTDWVRSLAVIRPLSVDELLLDLMCVELPTYLSEAKSTIVNRADVHDFTEAVLQFWRSRVSLLPGWARAARIVFAMSCNSASCERVFSLLDSMFSKEQRSALSDYVGGSLMLKYNKRTLG
jgi:hypothetical protein